MITIIHPSRGRPEKSLATCQKWMANCGHNVELIVSLDADDDYNKYINLYSRNWFLDPHGTVRKEIIINKNRSCVDAINNAVKESKGHLFIVVSDDSDCFPGWDQALYKALDGKSDFLLKTDDTIQNYIVTMTVCDRTYYERDGYIYHPDFFHQFADTYMTCVADIRGRLIHSKLKFPHNHYSYSAGKEMADDLNKRNDATWMQGQDTFVKLMKEFTPEERNRIQDKPMRNFLKRFGL